MSTRRMQQFTVMTSGGRWEPHDADLIGVGQEDRRRLQPGFDVDKAGSAQTPCRRGWVGKLPGTGPAREERGVRRRAHDRRCALQETRQVWAPATLGDEQATRLDGVIQVPEESRVVPHPVEGRRAEDDVGHLIQVESG